MWGGGGVADQNVDLSETGVGLVDEMLQRFFRRDIGGYGDGGCAADGCIDLVTRRLADVRLARGNNHIGAVLDEAVGDGFADAAR